MINAQRREVEPTRWLMTTASSLSSSIVVNTTVSNGGSVTLGNFTPVNPLPGEFGLLLNYTAVAPQANSTADITWSYNVTGVPFINDAFLALAGNTTGSGQAQVSEI